MFGFVKKLLGKKTDERDEGAKELPAASSKPSTPAVTVSARSGGAPAPTAGAGATSGALKGATAAHATGSASGSGMVQVSLLGIVSLLPTELKPARAVGDMASVQILFGERPLLEQLSQGCIRVPFSEVRKLAPEGFFTAGSEFDQKLVELPLQEVLPQLQGKALGRRASQKTTHVPEEVTSLFSARGNLVAPPPSSAPARSASAQPGNPPSSSATPAQGAASSSGHTSHTTRSAASGSGNTAHTTRSAPSATNRPPGPLKPRPAAPPGQAGTTGDAASTQNAQAKAAEVARNAPVAFRPPEPPPAAPEPAAAVEPPPPVSKPIAAPNLMAAMKGGAAGTTPKRAEPATTPVSAPINAGASLPKGLGLAATPSPAAAPGETVTFHIGQLAGAWPDPVKQDIARWNLEAVSIALPAEEIGTALKQGRVRCTWSRLLGALSPDLRGDKQSAVGDTELDLPLAVVAPAFLGRQRSGSAAAGSTRPAGSPLSDIPDLFHAAKTPGTPAPAATPASTQASGDTARFRKPASTVSAPAVSPSHSQPASVPPTAPQTIGVPLAMIDESWPDALKAEISRAQVPGVKMELPVEDIDRSLKSGKIEYTWRQLRSWLKPALPGEVGAEHADRLLTLPLKVIAPLFLGQVKPIQARRKVDPNSDIPDLFSGGAGPAAGPEAHAKEAAPAPASPAAKPAESAPAVGPELAGGSTFSTTQFFRKPPADLGELFGQPGKRNWTPNDIVQNTCRIRGVAGAVIAMQDGLLVAAQMPSPWKAEATAAFLPQIYSRLNQYLKELSVSELSSVTLNTANGTLFVFNAGIIYFAVVGKPEDTLPLAPIKLIVSELSRHTK